MRRRQFIQTSALFGSSLFVPNLLSCKMASPLPAKTVHQGHFPNIIIGSGYGGAVSALRLAERGQRVLILEMGQRWDRTPEHDTFAKCYQQTDALAGLADGLIRPLQFLFHSENMRAFWIN